MEDSRNVQDEVESIGLRGDGARCGRDRGLLRHVEGERPEPVAVDARKRLQVDGPVRVPAGGEDPRARAAQEELGDELEPDSTAGALDEEHWRQTVHVLSI